MSGPDLSIKPSTSDFDPTVCIALKDRVPIHRGNQFATTMPERTQSRANCRGQRKKEGLPENLAFRTFKPRRFNTCA